MNAPICPPRAQEVIQYLEGSSILDQSLVEARLSENAGDTRKEIGRELHDDNLGWLAALPSLGRVGGHDQSTRGHRTGR